MRRTQAMALAVLTAFAATAAGCGDDDLFDIDLQGVWEASLSQSNVPPPHAVNGTGHGTAGLQLADGDLLVIVTITRAVTSPVIGASIHGPATPSSTAPVALDLTPRMSDVINAGLTAGQIVNAVYDLESLVPSTTGELRVAPQALIDMFNSRTAYVQVDTDLNPDGELRGTIARSILQ